MIEGESISGGVSAMIRSGVQSSFFLELLPLIDLQVKRPRAMCCQIDGHLWLVDPGVAHGDR